MKVLLAQLPHFYDGTARPPTYYPLGLGYLAAVLRPRHEVLPLDLWLDACPVDLAIDRIRQINPDVLGISVYSTQYPYFKELVVRLEQELPGLVLVAGGPGATFSYQVMLTCTPIDFCVLGEGERTFPDLLEHLQEPDQVPGIAFRQEQTIRVTPPRPLIANLDELPLPDRSLFDFERYVTNYREGGSPFSGHARPAFRGTNLVAGRGCPYLCTFCSKTFPGLRLRSVETMTAEMLDLKKRLDIDVLEFNDELLLINRPRMLRMCDELRKMEVQWGCQGRINLVDEEILAAMKTSGCLYVGYGVESYTQEILDRMKKSIKVEQILPAIRKTREAGILPLIQYMFGFPGEDQRSIKRTERFFREVDHPYVGSITTPIPGTELYEEARKKGLITDEEAYLTALESGYNRSRPLVNLTEFSDEEFMRQYRDLGTRIDRRYYARHPGQILDLVRARGRRLLELLAHPGLLASKLKARLFGETQE